jgi:CDP-paratose 2-epimerase
VHKTAGQIYNVGGGPENTVSLLELIREIERLTGTEIKYTKERRRPGDQLIYVSNYSKLMQDTGWKPRSSVRQTLAAIYSFWNEHPEIFGEARLKPDMQTTMAASLALLERTA